MEPSLKTPSFAFTENRIEAAIKLMQSPKAPSRKLWRDENGDGLFLRASAVGGIYYWRARRQGKLLDKRLGDATRMKLTAARNAARLMAGGDMTQAKPVRVHTGGPTVEKVWQEYLEASRAGTFFAGRKPPRESTIHSYEENYNPHIRKQYANKSLAQLAKAVPTIHRKLIDKPATQKRLMQILHNLFLFARKQKYWSEPDPTIDPDTGKAIKCQPVKSRSKVIKHDDLDAMFKAAAAEPFPWNNYWTLLFLTDVRKSELCSMKWDDLDLRHKPPTWTIPVTKNDDPKVLALSATAAGMLKELQPNKKHSDFVFPMKDDPARCISDVYHAWNRIKKAAKLKDIRVHDIRRTAATEALRSGMSLPAVQRAGGWRSINSVAVYARAELSDAQQAASAVESVLLGLDK
jgi:integrase